MKRRSFLKNTALATAGTIAVPYILPSGRLFAQTGTQLAEHVVYVLFAGGVRHQEAVGQRYLKDSQYAYDPIPENDVEGNIMPNMLVGEEPELKRVYGIDPPEGAGPPGSISVGSVLGNPLQNQGVLFKEMTCGSAGHYIGLSSLISGNYGSTQGLRSKPTQPTIFEYVRRHMGAPATKTWFVGNGIGNSTPLLNYSVDPDYGAQYGANFFAPSVTFGELGIEYLSDAKNYHPDEMLSIYEMKEFLDNSFYTTGGVLPSIGNTDEEKFNIRLFMDYLYEKGPSGVLAGIPGGMVSGDVRNIAYACEVMQWFKPTVTVVNISGVDSCHGNFTNYLRALYRADYGVGYLWNYIQSIPEMAGNTALVLAPECGRNSEPNAITDFNDWFAYDHSDANANRTFAMMAGSGVPNGETIENISPAFSTDTAQCCLTVAELLGIKEEVISAGKVISPHSLFDML